MKYEILNKGDLTNGAMFVVRIPEKLVDGKALKTLQHDLPPFIVPFRCRNVDEFLELTFLPGDRTPLKFVSSRKSAQECATFWGSVLQPLIDCSDWFLKSSSFVLDLEYLYCSRDGKTVCYFYIPTTETVGTQEQLNAMISEISHDNPVDDMGVENQILRAVMQNVQPKAFLQMLRATAQGPIQSAPREQPRQPQPPRAQPQPRVQQPVQAPAAPAKPQEPKVSQQPYENDDAVRINLHGGKKKEEKEKKRWSLFGGKKKEPKNAAPVKGPGQRDMPVQPAPAAPEPVYPPAVHGNLDGATQISNGRCQTGFRYDGGNGGGFPAFIPVDIQSGGMFTIGRFDVKKGIPQSNFEFREDTMAVSRHHAVVQRSEDGSYKIMDLSSSAGTFMEGIQLLPNVAADLKNGAHVSFGNAGANYVWIAFS